MKLTNVPAPNHLTCVFTIFNVLLKTKERKMEANSSQTQHSVFKRPLRYIGQLKLTVLLVITAEQAFNMTHLHFYSTYRAFVMGYCFS